MNQSTHETVGHYFEMLYSRGKSLSHYSYTDFSITYDAYLVLTKNGALSYTYLVCMEPAILPTYVTCHMELCKASETNLVCLELVEFSDTCHIEFGILSDSLF